jgi:WD repeat-containing protein 35
MRVCLAVDSNILFANIQPNYMWGYFSKTLVFAFRKPERNDMCIVFWDTTINERHVKYMNPTKEQLQTGSREKKAGRAHRVKAFIRVDNKKELI